MNAVPFPLVLIACVLCSALFPTSAAAAESAAEPAVIDGDREGKVRADRERFAGKHNWLYNDITAAFRIAERTGKPIMVVLRCIPCEECVKLDDDLINDDPAIATLMKRFVLLRLTGTNGLDLQTFQFDTDQSFAVFFLNHDKTVYGRFGTRSHRTEWEADVSVAGLAQAMSGALALHRGYPANREQLRGKSDRPTEFATPEKFPTLKDKPSSLNWESRNFAKGVVKNCIHCHQISEARVDYYWAKKDPVPEFVRYPYPHPKAIGLILDPRYPARVVRVVPDSPAAASGVQPGDDIVSLQNQPLISIADVQWVLHGVPADGGTVSMHVRRGNSTLQRELVLNRGWRRKDDTSWRTGHWILRRSMLGGMKLTQCQNGTESVLKVEYVGNWGPFGKAKQAGVRKNDIILQLDDRTDLKREADVFDYIAEHKQAGDFVQLKLSREGRTVSARYKIQ